MNIDAKILKKIPAIKSNNALKGSYTMIKWDLTQDCKDFAIPSSQSV